MDDIDKLMADKHMEQDKINYAEDQALRKQCQVLYKEWKIKQKTVSENRLWDLVGQYDEEFFEDLQFKPGSIVTPFIEYMMEDESDEKFYTEPQCEITSFDSMYCRLRVGDLEENTEGQVNLVNRIMTIPEKYVDNKSVVLHEMLHVYVNELYPELKDILIVCLYRDLEKRIPDIDDRLTMHAHINISEHTSLLGGEHSMLFFLKSLDLDLRCSFKLGSVCGYGRDEVLTFDPQHIVLDEENGDKGGLSSS